MSLTYYGSLPLALMIFLCIGLAFFLLWKRRYIRIQTDVLYAALIVSALMISPYASMQSVISASVFMPMATFIASQYLVFLVLLLISGANNFGPLIILGIFLLAWFAKAFSADLMPTQDVS